jgi:hypothetical protein
LLTALALFAWAPAQAAALPDPTTLRGWIEEMKESPKGPFERIRWYCKDGTVLPPKAYACRDHGGGVQHGEWNERAAAMRAGGYQIANVFAGIDPAPFLGANADLGRFDQILLERFLMKLDDGWILRGARSYRGALQAEDEEAGAKTLVLAMLADPAWLEATRFTRLRESIRLFPLPLGDEASAARVRHRALELAEKDKAFTPLRAKIHNVPDAGDADRVREYASQQAPSSLKKDYQSLAAEIDALYRAGGAGQTLEKAADALGSAGVAGRLRGAAGRLAQAKNDAARFSVVTHTLAELRDALPDPQLTPEQRLVLLATSLALEDRAYTLGTELLGEIDGVSRKQRLARLGDAASALYGVGFVSQRHLDGVHASLRIFESGPLTVDAYRRELRFLARAPEWSSRWLEFNFSEVVAHWMPIEKKSHLFNQDRMRGSPLLFYSRVIDGLSLDANQLAGIEHELFGKKVGAGLRALNPGLARGQLVAGDGDMPEGGFSREGIYLLPESTSHLPRVSGILTRGEGSSLSHVQLLARNLGIPNVVVTEKHLPVVQQHDSQPVVLAVSPEGVVQLSESSARWDQIFGEEKVGAGFVIRPDLEKLDLSPSMIPLGRLRASDSGRVAGPKGANLGELKHHFGEAVPDGFAITFGVFRMLLERPIRSGGPSAFEWMKQEYARLGSLRGAEQERETAAFLRRLRQWIEATDPGKGFRQGLRMALDRLGPDGTFGVFVRSDTNVEDLPGFTGAGLNLTVFNVVGYENVLAAVKQVWASPFTERAYGWRQSHMEQPEFVFPAVVVQRAFPSEKSGVLVTVDVDTGERGWLTVAVNEGVGGAVDGQAAESLKIDMATGDVRFLAQATAPRRLALGRQGGIDKPRASGAESVLHPAEIQELITFSRTVGDRFPSLQAENGSHLPADVEFGFRNGSLTLLQIRAFNESSSAQESGYLSQLDARFRKRGTARVDLNGVPRGAK